MEVLLLSMLLVLVLGSFFLDGSSLTWISQSGIALLFGLLVGMFLVLADNPTYIHHFNFDNNIFFHVLLPPIIYEAGFTVKQVYFFSNFGAIASTAVLGTMIATGITGGGIYIAGIYGWITRLTWIESFLFGALVSAVDPVATLACFEKLNAPSQLFNIVFGESVLNDAVVIALYTTLNNWKSTEEFSAGGLFSVLGQTLLMLGGSLLVSAAITLIGAFLLNSKLFARLHLFPAYEISLCVIFSLMAYFAGEELGLSGIVSLFFSGMMTSHYHFNTLSAPAQQTFRHLLHTMAFVCETLVFVFMGTSLVFIFSTHTDDGISISSLDWGFIGFTVMLLLVSRFLNVVPLLSACNHWRRKEDRVSPSYMFVIWFAGLRGAISFALVKTWSNVDSNGVSHRPLIVSTTLIIVVFTTLIIGGMTGPLLGFIGAIAPKEVPTPVGRKSLKRRFTFVHSLANGDLVSPDGRRPNIDQNRNSLSFDRDLNEQVEVEPTVESSDQAPENPPSNFERRWKGVDENYLKRWFGGRIAPRLSHDESRGSLQVDDYIESPQLRSPKGNSNMIATPVP